MCGRELPINDEAESSSIVDTGHECHAVTWAVTLSSTDLMPDEHSKLQVTTGAETGRNVHQQQGLERPAQEFLMSQSHQIYRCASITNSS